MPAPRVISRLSGPDEVGGVPVKVAVRWRCARCPGPPWIGILHAAAEPWLRLPRNRVHSRSPQRRPIRTCRDTWLILASHAVW